MLERLTDDERGLLREARPPVSVPVTLATLTDERFSDPQWIFERKWDGIRCVAHRSADGSVRLTSRNDLDLTGRFPSVAAAVSAQGDGELVVDGEVVAMDGRRTSFEKLQQGGRPVYYVFDVLFAGGYDLRALPLRTRKKVLRDVLAFDDPLRFTAHRVGAGEQMFREACARGDEGVIAKRADTPYEGGRSKHWLKFKCVKDQELVLGGWTEPQGSRTDFGALLLGYWHGDEFRYAGKVGTGFTGHTLAEIGAALRERETDTSPFSTRVKEKGAHWARPELVAEIGFTEWTAGGMLRHPRFLGLRDDKDPREVVREQK
ncbi:ATP-dependent DNA ligase [Jatrophihabitans fulvus]